MLAKGWLLPFGNAQQLAAQVTAFWGWSKLDFSALDNQYIPFLTRKSEAFNQFNASYAITWYRKAIKVAEQFERLPYDKDKLGQLFDELHDYTIETDGISRFIQDLSEAGVLFFVLPHLQKTYLDGAAFFSGNNPVIVFTGRYKRIDNFWCTVAHEIAHVLHQLGETTPFVLDDLKDGDTSQMETEANALAAEKLKHPEILNYLEAHTHYLSTQKVEECAAIYRVHPSIVIGKLAHDKLISFSKQGLFNEDVLQLIPEKYKIINY
jgi:HTH-type transcriptional regulator/antitoxin HigA